MNNINWSCIYAFQIIGTVMWMLSFIDVNSKKEILIRFVIFPFMFLWPIVFILIAVIGFIKVFIDLPWSNK